MSHLLRVLHRVAPYRETNKTPEVRELASWLLFARRRVTPAPTEAARQRWRRQGCQDTLTARAGKLRGVAYRARKPKSTFGSGLERLSLVNIRYSQAETRELVSLNSCDLLQSQFNLLRSFEAGVVLDYIAELSDHLLPANEPNERFFRLLTAVLQFLHGGTEGAFRILPCASVPLCENSSGLCFGTFLSACGRADKLACIPEE